VAAVIDGIIFLPVLFVEDLILRSVGTRALIFAGVTFFALLPILYSIMLHFRFGQTYGKWVVGVRVLNSSETKKMTLQQAILRDSVPLVVQLGGLCYYLSAILKPIQQNDIINDYNRFGETLLFVWTVLELSTMLINSKRRAIHDFLANSVVVRTPT
jgi:uncharacterized RDD family membrane protein YckC